MRIILNPVKWLERRGELVNARAKAIKQHRPRKDIEAELREITTALVAYANRRDDHADR